MPPERVSVNSPPLQFVPSKVSRTQGQELPLLLDDPTSPQVNSHVTVQSILMLPHKPPVVVSTVTPELTIQPPGGQPPSGGPGTTISPCPPNGVSQVHPAVPLHDSSNPSVFGSSEQTL